MIALDGSVGEGGGQILRTALSASLLTGRAVHVERIRAGRRHPGLLHQHLAAVHAAADVGDADVEGADLGSQSLVFRPRRPRAGNYEYDVGTAGSASLVLQTVLVPLLAAEGESVVTIHGGTHNQAAPPFEFLDLVYAPLLRRMGAGFELRLDRPGFYPVGGGSITASILDASWSLLDLSDRGGMIRRYARAVVSRLPLSIAERELAVVERRLGWEHGELFAETVTASGPGNVIMLVIQCEHATGMFTGFGQRGVQAETVADGAIAEARRYLDADVPVGSYLADQLLLPLAAAGGGRFLTLVPSTHFDTNVTVLRRFFDVDVVKSSRGPDRVFVEVRRVD